ncbi:MAG: hypothetical protein P0Y65_21010 [Candidatus Devosia phytovorans]|uniref:Uncharacterized protein n=1 Tax=Candidatus Devosia phytovorans TaxID=3121372 RepID=A0AAJ5VWC9_9HYPH|nr:hypothetical protein [Devosia sp.]WEK04624.1 MAG: hypothetical protein P0Y65_21010 [Devosia sp.]
MVAFIPNGQPVRGFATHRLHEVQLRLQSGVVKLGEVRDPADGLRIGKGIAEQQIAFGGILEVVAVEVLDLAGNIVLGEEVINAKEEGTRSDPSLRLVR